MKINNKGSSLVGVTYDKLTQGQVYTDEFNEYVMATDQNYLIKLDDGVMWYKEDYEDDALFTPVKATLEIE